VSAFLTLHSLSGGAKVKPLQVSEAAGIQGAKSRNSVRFPTQFTVATATIYRSGSKGHSQSVRTPLANLLSIVQHTQKFSFATYCNQLHQAGFTNPKYESQNSKQYQMTKIIIFKTPFR
jgi:hypothetical protein